MAVAVLAVGAVPALAVVPIPASAPMVSPTTWARVVCHDMVDYLHDAARLERTLERSVQREPSARGPKAKLVAYLRANVSRADRLIRVLHHRGAPTTPNGGQLAATLIAGFVSVRDTFRSLEADAARLPTADAATFGRGFELLRAKLVDLQRHDQATFQLTHQFQTPALAQAFATQPACRALAMLT